MSRIARIAPYALLASIALAGSVPAHAAPSPDCAKPSKPAKFDSQKQADEFVQAAQSYLDCMKSFYEEQSALSKEHAQAANSARDAMQKFAAEANK